MAQHPESTREQDCGRLGGTYYNSEDRLIPLAAGNNYDIDVRVANNCKRLNAKGVRLKFSKLPKKLKKGGTSRLTTTLSGSNLSQSPIKNVVELVVKEDIKLTLMSHAEKSWRHYGGGSEIMQKVSGGNVF